MNSQDILLYTIFTVGALYGVWIISHIIWFEILIFYHYIIDEISYYEWKRRK